MPMRKQHQRRNIMQLCFILLLLHATFTESLKTPSGQFALLVHFTFYSSDCLKTQQINLMIRALALIDIYVEVFDRLTEDLLCSIKNSGIVRYKQTMIKKNSTRINRKSQFSFCRTSIASTISDKKSFEMHQAPESFIHPQ